MKCIQDKQNIEEAWSEINQKSSSIDLQKLLQKIQKKKKLETDKKIKPLNFKLKISKEIASVTEDTDTLNKDNIVSSDPPNENESAEQILTALNRDINSLADENVNARKKAVKNIYFQVFERRNLNPNVLQILCKSMFKSLLKRFNDSSDAVRGTSLQITTSFICHYEQLIDILPYLFPALMNRVSHQWQYDDSLNIFSRSSEALDAHKRGRLLENDADKGFYSTVCVEPSEEVRLLHYRLIEILLKRSFELGSSSLLHPYFMDIICVIISGLHDSHQEVNIMSCNLLALLAENMVSATKHFAIALVRANKHLLYHRLSKVRLGAIYSIAKLVSCPNIEKCKGAGTEAILDLVAFSDENVIPIASFYRMETKVNYFAKLDQDPNPSVRKAFYNMVGEWLYSLPDRYDYETRLMPYVLSGLNDETNDIVTMTMIRIEQLGKQYEEDNPDSILEKKQYGVDGNPEYNYTKSLPSPFLTRPSLGSRLFIRGKCRRFINVLLKELSNWMSKTKLHAARLLKCIIVYSEEHITMDIHNLIKTLLVTCEDPEIKDEILLIADLVGRYVEPSTYLSLINPYIVGDCEVSSQGDTQSRCRALNILDKLLQGSLSKQVLPHVINIISTLHRGDLINSELVEIQTQLIKVTFSVVNILKGNGKNIVESYFCSTGRLTSLKNTYQEIFELVLNALCNPLLSCQHKLCESSIEIIAEVHGIGNGINGLISCYGHSMLENIFNFTNFKSTYDPIINKTMPLFHRRMISFLIQHMEVTSLQVYGIALAKWMTCSDFLLSYCGNKSLKAHTILKKEKEIMMKWFQRNDHRIFLLRNFLDRLLKEHINLNTPQVSLILYEFFKTQLFINSLKSNPVESQLTIDVDELNVYFSFLSQDMSTLPLKEVASHGMNKILMEHINAIHHAMDSKSSQENIDIVRCLIYVCCYMMKESFFQWTTHVVSFMPNFEIDLINQLIKIVSSIVQSQYFEKISEDVVLDILPCLKQCLHFSSVFQSEWDIINSKILQFCLKLSLQYPNNSSIIEKLGDVVLDMYDIQLQKNQESIFKKLVDEFRQSLEKDKVEELWGLDRIMSDIHVDENNS